MHLFRSLIVGFVVAVAALPTEDITGVHNSTDIGGQVGPPPCVCSTVLVGNGDPHQEYHQIQQTHTVSDCGTNVTCTTTKSSSHSISWGVSAGLMQKDGWVNGGFNVQETTQTGTSEGCTATGAKNICLWYSAAYTAYTVQTFCNEGCGGKVGGRDKRVIYSPNTNNNGGLGYYCVKDTCQELGSSYWKVGAATGPPS